MNPEDRARIITEVLCRLGPSARPVASRDIELLMMKHQRFVNEILSKWETKEGEKTLIYQPDPNDLANFVVHEAFERFGSFSKEELLYVVVLGLAQNLCEDLAATTNAVNRIKI